MNNEHLIYYLINKYINIIPTSFTTYKQYKKIIGLLNGIQKLLRQFQLYHTRGRIIQIILIESGLMDRLETILNYPFNISKEELNTILDSFESNVKKSTVDKSNEEVNDIENKYPMEENITNSPHDETEHENVNESNNENNTNSKNITGELNIYIKKILSSVIKTTTELLSGNNYLKQVFKNSYDGYEKIYKYIKKYKEFDGAIIYLFGMLVENDLWVENTPAVIRNIDVLPIIVKIYKNADFKSKNFIIDQMQKLSEIHEINKMKLSNASFVGMILSEILPNVSNQEMLNKITKLIYTISTFNLSIPEAKQMFKMLRQIDVMNEKRSIEDNKERVMARSQLNGWDIIMKNKNPKFKVKEKENSIDDIETEPESYEGEENKLLLPYYYDNLIKILFKIMTTKNTDSDFFYFSGLNSGIYIPELKDWPTSEGYTIMTWIKVESFDIEEISSGVTNTKYMNVTKKGKVVIKNNKVTNFNDYDNQNQYCPHIFSLTSRGKNNRNTNGLDLFFIENKIYISVTRDDKKDTYSISDQYEFLPNRWYHIALVHESPKLWVNTSDLSLYIDGRLNKITKVKYPKSCHYQQSYIGCKGRTNTFSEISIQDVYQSFCGQMISFNIFNCILYENSIANINSLLDEKSKVDSIAYSESFLSEYSKILQPEEFSSLILCYHPKASETDNNENETSYDRDSLDDSDQKKEDVLNILFNKKYGNGYNTLNFEKKDTYKLYYYLFKIFNANSVDIINNLQINNNSINVNHAYLFSVSRTSTKCLRNILHSLGGINVLLPLLLHSNLNRIDLEPNSLEIVYKNENFDLPNKTITEVDIDQHNERLITFIQMIIHLIESDSFYQNKVKSSYFLPIMSYLLYNYVNYSYLTIRLFELFENFAIQINDESIEYNILSSVLFNPRLWAMASINVQIYYYSAIQKYINTHYSICKEHFGVSHFLKILEKHYYYIPIKENKIYNYVKNMEDLKIIRKLILNIIYQFIKNDSTYEEIEAILDSFILDIDYQHSSELLQLLKKLIVDENDKNVINNIIKYDHLNFFIKLIRNSDSVCRIESLKIINYMLRMNNINEKWKEKLHNDSILLIQSLEEFPITSEVCYQLFEMSIEEDLSDGSDGFSYINIKNLKNTDIKNIKVLEFLIYLVSNQNTKNHYSQSILPDDLRMEISFADEEDEFSNSINNEEMEKTMKFEKEEETVNNNINEQTIKQIPKYDQNNELPEEKEELEEHESNAILSPKKEGNQSFVNSFEVLKVEFLENLFFLFKINKSNCLAFMKNIEWPKLLISLIPEGAFNKYKNDAGYNEDTNTNIIENMIIEIFYILLNSSFENSKSWQELYNIVFFYFTIHIEDSFTGVKAILNRYLQKINGDLLKTNVYSHAKYDNIIHLIHFTEDWLFNHNDFKEIYYKIKKTEPNINKSFFDISIFDNRVLKMPSKSVVTNESLNISYPWEESKESCEILINALLNLINTLPANIIAKVFTKNDSLIRILFRFLNSGIGIYNKVVWEFIIKTYQTLLNGEYELKMDNSLYCSTLGHLINGLDMCKNDIKDKEDRELFYNKLLNINYKFTNLWWNVIVSLKPPINDNFSGKSSITLGDYILLLMEDEIQKCNDKIFQPSIRTFDESCYSMVFDSCRSFEKTVSQIITNIRKKVDENEKKELLRIKKEDENMNELKEEQIELIIKSKAKDDNRNKIIEKKWNTLIHEMSRDRGLWFFETGSTLTWKLDYTENIKRIRRRLIPNYEFEDHLDASFKRDRVKNDSVDMFLKIPKTTEKKKSKFEKMREKYTINDTGSINNTDHSNITSTTPSSFHLEDDISENDQWSILTSNEDLNSEQIIKKEDEKVVFKADCDLVMLTTTISGYLLLTSKNLYFFLNPLAVVTNITNSGQEGTISSPIIENELLRDRQWKLDEISDIYIRRYLLKRSAIEFFFTDHTNIFFNFHISKESFKFFRKLINLHPVNLRFKEAANPSEVFKKYHNITEMWKNRKISNFDYIMFLNTISGRTFNDLTQYPVFPWIIQDYTSETIDLNDPGIYRDLSKPIGALNEARLEHFKERYYSFEEMGMEMDDIKPFFYGTHYSSAANVLFYMIRMEPFTTLHIALQSGKFDHPDRQFFSLQNCWDSVINNSGDVKELIPEFFSTPEFLVNMNHFDLGKCNAIGKEIDDVILPPWAKTPEEFIRIQREALESEYVSNNINNWIDLIWGYKQRGEEAVKAFNVFYYLTYEGAVDIDHVKDPIKKKSIEDQINNFGQTPPQLLTKPHPKRNPAVAEVTLINSFDKLIEKNIVQEKTPILKLFIYKDPYSEVERLIYVEECGQYTLIDQPINAYPAKPSLFIRKILSSNSGRVCNNSSCFATLANKLSIINGGYWDNSLVVNTFDETQYSPLYGHFDIVTAVAITKNVDFIVTGSKDTTVISWEIDMSNNNINNSSFNNDNNNTIIKPESKKIYYGHDNEITALAVDSSNDIIVTGSKDGSCIIYTLREAKFLHSFKPFKEAENNSITIKSINITDNADIIVFAINYTKKQYLLQLYSVNGKLLMESYKDHEIKSLLITNDQKHLIIADTNGVFLLNLYDFNIIYQYSSYKDVVALALTSNEKKLFLGHLSGKINLLEVK
ncbi:beach-domain-containing protein [Piromyces finnis]|uniref:Beige protein homolog 1 n=1 Tax=Piromyces finnis TaxID=1754191 RepID=A0A1Y1VGN8_9FUNG|nr:beach-domain-containing protein [Piromyces finnis]|eukprot:ORX55869.1 beach-domain-containing protein [Piromyces finnis]